MSLQEGEVQVPLEWKEPNDIPLFKKSVNYRHARLMSAIVNYYKQLFEIIMVDFLIKHKLINPSQHGFLKARSCLTNLIYRLRKQQNGLMMGHR